ncbi:MAG: hypothetical protein ACFFDC_20685, partial [Promethearchaeota archaeon]
GFGFGTSLCLSLYRLLIIKPILIIILYCVSIGISCLLGLISATIYDKTRNFLSPTIFNSLILAFFISGKLFLVYA